MKSHKDIVSELFPLFQRRLELEGRIITNFKTIPEIFAEVKAHGIDADIFRYANIPSTFDLLSDDPCTCTTCKELEDAKMKTLKERSLAAYEAGAVAPGFHGWGDLEKQCGCAMTAIAMHEAPETFPTLASVLVIADNGTDELCEKVGITRRVMLGFTDAFDGNPHGTSHIAPPGVEPIPKWRAEYNKGYIQGKETREAVFDKYFPDGYVLTEGDMIDEAK